MAEESFSVADVVGAEKLTSIFGGWPTFHDAQVLRVELRCEGVDGEQAGPTLFVRFLLCEWSSEIDSAGRYRSQNHVEVIFRFHQIEQLKLTGYHSQNAVDELFIIDRRKELWAKGWETVWFEVHVASESELSFRCQVIEIIDVVPSTKPVIARYALSAVPPSRDGR